MTNTIFLVLLVIYLVLIIKTHEEARKKDTNHGPSDKSTSVKNRHQLKDVNSPVHHPRRSHFSLEKGGSVRRRSTKSKSPKDGNQPNPNTATLAPAMPIDFAVKAEVLVDGFFSICPANMSMQCPGCKTNCSDTKPCSIDMTKCVTSEQLCDCDYQKGFVRDYLTPHRYQCIQQSDCMKCPPKQKPTCFSEACPVVTCTNNAQWIDRVSDNCIEGIQDCHDRQCDCDYENGYVRKVKGNNFECIKRAQCITCNDKETAVCPASNCKEVAWSNKIAKKKKDPCPSEEIKVQNCSAAPVCHCKKPYLRNDDKGSKTQKGECVSYNHFCASYDSWKTAYCLKPTCIIACKKRSDTKLPNCPSSGPEYEECWDGGIESASFECGCADGKLRYTSNTCVTKDECLTSIEQKLSRKGKKRRLN